MMLVDCHTHTPSASGIYSLRLGESPAPEVWYSAGIHPWEADRADDYWPWLEQMAAHPQCLMIGESGLDALRGADADVQEAVFKRQASMADETGKPLLIHNVRMTHRLLGLHKSWRPRVPWIMHGFRGNAATLDALLRQGLDVTFGDRFNAGAVAAIPADKLLIETDCYEDGIVRVAEKIALARHCPTETVMYLTAGNLERLLNHSIS